MEIETQTPPRALADIKRPSQKRSRERFEAILDAAARRLEHFDPAAITVHMIAADLGISPPSIYQFFPEAPLIFAALAERYLIEVRAVTDVPIAEDFATWQDLMSNRFERGRSFFNHNIPARKVLLGPALSFDIRTRDLNSDELLAAQAIAAIGEAFDLPTIAEIHERFVEIIVISDAIWALSIHRFGDITDAMAVQASRARIAYARTFLPEYLPSRRAADPRA